MSAAVMSSMRSHVSESCSAPNFCTSRWTVNTTSKVTILALHITNACIHTTTTISKVTILALHITDACIDTTSRFCPKCMDKQTVCKLQFKMAVTVYRCLRESVPGYLAELCIPMSNRSSCLQSTASRQLVIPPVKLSSYGHRVLAISGP